MKRLRELETEYVRLTLLEEEGVGFYVRERGLGYTNDHDTMKKYQTKDEANAEINRIEDMIRGSGCRVICDTQY